MRKRLNADSELPDEAIVAATLLAGHLPCISCGNPVKEGFIVCPECNVLLNVDKPRLHSDFIDYRDKPGRPIWFRNSRRGLTQSPEQLAKEAELEAAELIGAHTAPPPSPDSKSNGLSRKSKPPRAKADRVVFADFSSTIERGQLAAFRRALDRGKKIARYWGLGGRKWSKPPGNVTPNAVSGWEPPHTEASNRLLAPLCKMTLGPSRPGLEKSYLLLRFYGYGEQEALSCLQKWAPLHRKPSS